MIKLVRTILRRNVPVWLGLSFEFYISILVAAVMGIGGLLTLELKSKKKWLRILSRIALVSF